MGLSPQHLFESSTADRLLLAWHLHLDRATVVSGRWRPFSISSSVARNHCRFPSRPSFVANDKDRFAHSNLGVGAFCAQPSFANGLWISRKHRSGHGYVSHARVIVLFARQIGVVWTFSGLQLSDQGYSVAVIADLLFLLAVAASRCFVLGAICLGLACFVGRTAVEISNVVCKKRSPLWKLLGNLGHHLLVASDQSSDVQDGNGVL